MLLSVLHESVRCLSCYIEGDALKKQGKASDRNGKMGFLTLWMGFIS